MKFLYLLKQAQFHGARILIDSRFSWYWTISLATLFGSSIVIVYIATERFLVGPTFITQTEQVRKSILFPTVIICPEISYPDYKVEGFIKDLKFPPAMSYSYIRRILPQLAAFASPDAIFNVEELEDIQDLLNYNDLDVDDASLRLTPSCEEILLKCRWLQNVVNCSSLFTMEITRAGFCCVFNGRSLKREINNIIYYEPSIKKKHYVNGVGFTNSLTVAVQQRDDLFDIDLTYKWVALRPGFTYVDITVNGTPISPGQETWISYKTRTTEASEDIINLRPNLRHCRLANEPLKLFPVYHKTYCLMECEMERTLKRCQCLKLAQPSFPGVPLCRARQLTCSRYVSVSFAINECNCSSTCNTEEEESYQHVIDLYSDSPTYDSFYDGLHLENVSVIRVFVPNHIEKVFERKSYFNMINLFSQLGGVFNVFFGCSVLTLLELVMLAWRGLRYYINRNNAYYAT